MAEGEDTMALTFRRRRFTLDEYHRMGEARILGEDDRVELIEGEIIERSPIGSRHAGTVARIHHLFSTRLGDRAVVWSQNPLLLARHQSEPQPDVMLLAPRTDFYTGGLPEPPDVRLLVEVAGASLLYDRRTKFPLYGRSGVAEAWLVDLEAGRIEIHRGVAGARYRDVRLPRADEPFSPTAFPDLIVTLGDLLG
ncbi:MAG: Uma2 family endonuclease [Candidatus Rokuibacteriota bacterium]